MVTLQSPQIVQQTLLRWKQEGPIAFVPTMGCLHEGHLDLVRKALTFGKKTVVSIFVNPLQFGPREDFNKYPRPFDEDEAKLEKLDVDLLFAPTVKDLYPDGFSTRVDVTGLTQPLCGRTRQGHFEGVATVCLKLFQITQADFAVFGEKDFQQLKVIEQMVSDLNLPLSIIPHAIVREPDGLAMSSRNRYLSSGERARASSFPKALFKASEMARKHTEIRASELVEFTKKELIDAGIDIEYIELASERDLVPAGNVPLRNITNPRLFGAIRMGHTRLIDNLSVSPKHS